MEGQIVNLVAYNDAGWRMLSHYGEWMRIKGIVSGKEHVVHYSKVKGGFIKPPAVKPSADKAISAVHAGQAGGLKFDAGKDQWGLLLSGKGMLAAVRGVVHVLMFGAKKYAAHSWRDVEDNERRYLDGLMRHYSAIMEHGLKALDEESGMLHIDHLNCNGLFLGELARKE